MLAVALAAAGAFVAIYHPVGTALLIEAAADRPGRAIGVNGVCGNVGVALAPVITAFLAAQVGWRAGFVIPAVLLGLLGLAWLAVPHSDAAARRAQAAFPPIPRHLVRRAVVVLLLIAVASGLVFNAFTVLIPKLMQERLAASPSLLPLAGAAATLATLCGAATQFTVGRMIDRMTLKRVFLPMALVLTPSLLLLAVAPGWAAVPLAGAVAATVFGQVTVNETMAARYISPALRVRLYSWRFFVSFLGAAAAPPLVGFLFQRTGSLAASLLVLAGASPDHARLRAVLPRPAGGAAPGSVARCCRPAARRIGRMPAAPVCTAPAARQIGGMHRRTLILLPAALLLGAAASAPVAAPLTPADRADLGRIEAYLNAVDTLKAHFLQIAPDGSTAEGTAWMQRPGRMRFQYDPPAPLLLIAGHGVFVYYDRELRQVTNIPLGQTPLGILLARACRAHRRGDRDRVRAPSRTDPGDAGAHRQPRRRQPDVGVQLTTRWRCGNGR